MIKDNNPTSIIIFGASGDLTKRKLVPALYNLYIKGRLAAEFNIIGLSRSKFSSPEFRTNIQSAIKSFAEDVYDDAWWEKFKLKLHYIPFDISNSDDFKSLGRKLDGIDGGSANRLFYLSTAPRFFSVAIKQLGKAGLVKEKKKWRRVIIEKPFGRDLASAMELNSKVHSVLAEHQVYRIDHYLAKETVQNILVFRFANTIFEPVWNRNYIEHVQITASETLDIGHRGEYYDRSGVLRDMFQNHLLQLLALTCMEAPASFEADALRNEKVKLLSSVRFLDPLTIKENTILGQYEGYRSTPGVSLNSKTPTYAALRLDIDNWRWKGVPFYLRSGKALAEKVTQINVQFKSPPHLMFPVPADFEIRSNVVSICIQPDEAIHLRFEAKVPDTPAEMRSVEMDFQYDESFGSKAIPDAYERLLLDAINGDPSLFTRADGIEKAWKIIDPIISYSESEDNNSMTNYQRGSWGPEEAELFLNKDGRRWRMGCAD